MVRINLFVFFGLFEVSYFLFQESLADAGVEINLFGGVDTSATFSNLEYELNKFISRCQQSEDKLPTIIILHLGLTYSEDGYNFIALIENVRKIIQNVYIIIEGHGYQDDKHKLKEIESLSDLHIEDVIPSEAYDLIVDYINRMLR